MTLKTIIGFEIVIRYYIDIEEYKNLILVNKDYYQIFSQVKEPLTLKKILYKEGFLDPSDMPFIKTIKGKMLIDLLIMILEPKRNSNFIIKYDNVYKPINYIIARQIKKRLDYLNMLGF